MKFLEIKTPFRNCMKNNPLGQFYTKSDIVDLILSITVTNKRQNILDPGCGHGIFLQRAYSRLIYINKSKNNKKKILNNIWGIDISPSFKLLDNKNYFRNILKADFFKIKPSLLLKKESFCHLKDLTHFDKKIGMPKFDIIVANPPFTRQERIDDSMGKNYKEKLIKQIEEELNHTISLSKRTSLYAYFIYHSSIFLKNNGVMGYITPNLWLSVDYGTHLQEFLLKNFKIKAIVGSKVERFFEFAEVDTIIIILEKCSNESERLNNVVKFIQLRDKLVNILDKFTNITKREDLDENERWQMNDAFWNYINDLNNHTIDREYDIRIFPIAQQELWNHGYDKKVSKYVGSRWDIFLRAPDIYFALLEKGKDLWVPLKEIGTFRRGFTTGANQFFYIPAPGNKNKNFYTEKDPNIMDLLLYDSKSNQLRFSIEKEYWMHKKSNDWVPNYLIKSPRESDFVKIKPESLNQVVLIIHDNKQNLKKGILNYIKWGESQGFHNRRTMKNRQRWYDLGVREPYQILFPKRMGEKFYVYFNNEEVYSDQTLYEIAIDTKRAMVITLSFLNSTLGRLFYELAGYELTGSVTVAELSEFLAGRLLTINPDKISNEDCKKLKEIFKKLCITPIDTIYNEIGAKNPETVSLNEIKPLRYKLDNFFYDFLNLSNQQKVDTYKAVVDLLNSRIIKSKSIKIRDES